MAVENESFASRWSRRKQQVALEQEVELEDTTEVTDKVIEEDAAEDRLAKLNALTDEDMPDVDTLDEDSDFSGFMSVNVSEELRKLALNKLFHGKAYNIRDGLDEYDGDYTSFEKLDPLTITCDMKHLMEVEAEKLLAKGKAEEEKLLEEQALAESEVIESNEEELIESTDEELVLDEEILDEDIDVVESGDDNNEEDV